MPHPPEALIHSIVSWLRLGIETLGAGVVAVGVVTTVWRYLLSVFRHQATSFNAVRLDFARYLALALEFQLGADILSTAIAPQWLEIRNLGAIAIIRTALNFFLTREMQEEARHRQAENNALSPEDTSPPEAAS